MSISKGATGFMHGIAAAAMGLGVLLGVAWLGLWGVEAAGGPDWRMSIRLLQSASTLVLIGWLMRSLLQWRGAKETA